MPPQSVSVHQGLMDWGVFPVENQVGRGDKRH